MLKKLKSLLLGQSAPRDKAGSAGKGSSDHDRHADSKRLSHAMPGEFERVFSREESDPQSWIGVDLDGTLSEDTGAMDLQIIGRPIPEMVARIKDWIAHGYVVKVLTARASVPEGIPPVKAWLKEHHLPDLEVTDAKDLHMIELWDDRAVQVIANLGQPVGHSLVEPEQKETSDSETESSDASRGKSES